MISFHPVRIPGRWREGYALDLHTVQSTFLGDDAYGHARFDTERSPPSMPREYATPATLPSFATPASKKVNGCSRSHTVSPCRVSR